MNVTACSPATFASTSIYGAEILSLSAAWVSNYSWFAPADFNYNHGDAAVSNAQFCNVTVTYTHPGYDDSITVESWLPKNWNGRLQATGGGGWNAGRFVLSEFFMTGALAEGYATTTTDAGLDTSGPGSPLAWALKDPGNVDILSLQNLGSRSLNDQALFGKSFIESFYGRQPEYSYWSGCSQGGRQGLMLAQRYPTAYDGIAASAPAQSFTSLTSGVYYPQMMKLWLGVNPLACELEFLTQKAVDHCDPLDGVVDGVISNVTACNYNPLSAVNQTFHCDSLNKTIPLSYGAARIAEAAWNGPRTKDGEILWFGVNPGSDISSLGSTPGQNTTTSTGTASPDPWFGMFVAKNASFDLASMTHDQYIDYFHRAVQQYSSFIDANDPNLSEFRKAGGKMLAYHGMADPSIPTKGTEWYYDSVTEQFPDVQDFYRFFEAPGLGHCSGGVGGQPKTVFHALRSWVENGTAPESLPVEFAGVDGTTQNRNLCPYPAQMEYVGGDSADAKSFRCVHDRLHNLSSHPTERTSDGGYRWILTPDKRVHIASMLDCDLHRVSLHGNVMVQNRAQCACGKFSGLDDLVQNVLAAGIHSTTFMLDVLEHGPKNGSPSHTLSCSACGAAYEGLWDWRHAGGSVW
ncbi:tannase and feruloyl esterase-domain-containing protein [Aspergillus multicolor]|uniref:putative feruloyl esterase n=1 Tax=Aspergillus multicolor TaxID=41759 RepID=UPI003CCD6F78